MTTTRIPDVPTVESVAGIGSRSTTYTGPAWLPGDHAEECPDCDRCGNLGHLDRNRTVDCPRCGGASVEEFTCEWCEGRFRGAPVVDAVELACAPVGAVPWISRWCSPGCYQAAIDAHPET